MRNASCRSTKPTGETSVTTTTTEPTKRLPSSSRRTRRRVLSVMLGCLFLLAGHPRRAHPIAGVEGTFEYAFDAPWRIEPSRRADGTLEYGAIPIQLTFHDVNQIYLDGLSGENPLPYILGETLGNVCAITVCETRPDGVRDCRHSYGFHELAEVEATIQSWKLFSAPPGHFLCKQWRGEDCSGLDSLAGTSEWHALLWHRINEPLNNLTSAVGTLPQRFEPGSVVPLEIRVEVTRHPGIACDGAVDAELISFTNYVGVELGTDPLPRFGPGWLYGDLHYHSQGTDNEGEAAYNYRGVIRAMGAMGLDFVFATEHASNSWQIVDADLDTSWFLEDFDKYVAEGHLQNDVLRDMSGPRFRFLQDLIHGTGGVNLEAALNAASGRRPQSILSAGAVPQIFLGGEVDVIPELAPDQVSATFVHWGNGQTAFLKNLCGGWSDHAKGDCDYDDLREPTPTGVLLRDNQSINTTKFYGRQHLVYLPRAPAPDAFIASGTSQFGGASRRLAEPHFDGRRPAMLPEIEEHGYAFIAHPLNGRREGNQGPNGFPWTDHMYDKAWRSPAILGLQFWNEDTRLTEVIRAWSDNDVLIRRDAVDACRAIGGVAYLDENSNERCFYPVAGDDIGYQRLDADTGQGNRTIPTDDPRAGLESMGRFELSASSPRGVWDESTRGRYDGVEFKLHHGAFTWDRLNHWGLDVTKTRELTWLSDGEPRRLFMAGGSDAHGDLNYRREGYFLGTSKLTDTAIGKPRNLVDAGSAATTTPDGAAVYRQFQVVDALKDGRFSITDGPALRIFIDHDEDCEFDRGDTPMGAIATIVRQGDALHLPLCVEWKSTPEFGPLERIDLYVGARSSRRDLASSEHASGRTYAPTFHGTHASGVPGAGTPLPEPGHVMYDNYWRDPTGQLRIKADDADEVTGLVNPYGETENLDGLGYEGHQLIHLDLLKFPAHDGEVGDRFFIRAFGSTLPLEPKACRAITADTDIAERTGECILRYAFTNPIWAIESPPDYIWMEAENGGPEGLTYVLQPPMQVASHPNASSGSYVYVPNGSGTKGRASYLFEVQQTGDYVIWGREASNNGGDDSFFVALAPFGSGGPALSTEGKVSVLWDTKRGGGTDRWVWDRVSDRGGADPVKWHLEAGRYYWLEIHQREDGTKLDRLLITSDLDFNPATRVLSTFERRTDRKYRDYRRVDLSTPNPGLCRKQCLRASRCAAWTYVEPGVQAPSARCWLKHTVPGRSANSVTTSGVKYSIEPGTDRAGQDYRVVDLGPDEDADVCRATCVAEAPRCRAWTYVEPGVQKAAARCWLKDSVPAATPSDCCTSGFVGSTP